MANRYDEDGFLSDDEINSINANDQKWSKLYDDLEAGRLDPNTKIDGVPILSEALKDGHVMFADELIQRGADVNAYATSPAAEKGMAPIHFAQGASAVRLLAENNADLDAPYKEVDHAWGMRGETKLQTLALQEDHPGTREVVVELIKGGADTDRAFTKEFKYSDASTAAASDRVIRDGKTVNEKLSAWLDSESPESKKNQPIQQDISAALEERKQVQSVADFIATNINRTPEKVAENVRTAPPELQSLLADGDRMKAIEKDVNKQLSGINSVYVAETKAVMAEAAGRSDFKAVAQEAQAVAAERPEVQQQRQAAQDANDARKVSEFIGANVNLSLVKIAQNTENAPPDLKAILADEEKMKRIEPEVDKQLVGISEKYIEVTRSVISASLTRPTQAQAQEGDARSAPVAERAALVTEVPPARNSTVSGQEEAAVLAESKRREALAAATGLSQDAAASAKVKGELDRSGARDIDGGELAAPKAPAAATSAGEKPSSGIEDDKPAAVTDKAQEQKQRDMALAAAETGVAFAVSGAAGAAVSLATTVAANKMTDREDAADNSVDVQRKGRELERGEFIIPRRIAQNYTEQDGKFYAKDTSRMMFHDQGEKLATSTTDKAAITDMVAYAKAKQWDSLKLTGSQDFRREAWLQAESQGIKTQGYTPREKDLIELKTLTMERSTNSITPVQDRNKSRTDLEKPVEAPRHDLNKNQAATASAAAQNNTTNIKELQAQPAMQRYSMDELSKIAFYRALVMEREKDSPPAARETAVANFDLKMRDPDTVKALPEPSGQDATAKTATKENLQKRDTPELSL